MDEPILVVDDEKELVETIASYLHEEGYHPIEAYDGTSALTIFREQEPVLVILDLGLPDINGFEVAKQIRHHSNVPLIILTARSQQVDRIVGLEIGADDYIVKPFSPRELMLRVEAILRRVAGKRWENIINIGDLRIDLEAREARLREEQINLTPTEFDLLAFLARQPNRVFTRMELLEQVQGYTTEALIRNIDNHVLNLRKKIEVDPAHPRYLLTVFGVGYKLSSSSS